MSYGRNLVESNTIEIMTHDPRDPQADLPFVSEDFWRAGIREFETAFLKWLAGNLSDDDALDACLKYQNTFEETRVHNKEVEPTDRLNGKTLGEEEWLCRRRSWTVMDAIEEIGCGRMRGDAPEIIRNIAYKSCLLGLSVEPKLREDVSYQMSSNGFSLQ